MGFVKSDSGIIVDSTFVDMEPQGRSGTDVHSPTSGMAVFAPVIGLLGVFLLPVPTASFALGLAAVVIGLAARRQLKKDPALSGSRLSLMGVLLGGCAVLISGPGLVYGVIFMIERAIRLQLG